MLLLSLELFHLAFQLGFSLPQRVELHLQRQIGNLQLNIV